VASIRKRNGKWQAQVRRLGHRPQNRTFLSRQDALAWARDAETLFDRGGFVPDQSALRELTLRHLIDRYSETVTPLKKGRRQELYRLVKLRQLELAQVPLQGLSASYFTQYRDKRLTEVSNQTVRHEMNLLRHVLNIAILEWSVPLPQNPVEAIRIPPQSKPRNRRLRSGELRRLFAACKRSRNPWLRPTVLLALETGMRRGELLSMRWKDADEVSRTVKLWDTKSGYDRIVPLSPRAWRTLNAMRSSNEHVIPTTESAIGQAWNRVVRRSGIPDLHFHDLRHEAISRFFEKGLSVPEVALISGHRDPRMLFRYTHLRAEDVAQKLNSLKRRCSRNPPVESK
jgi:integrase